MRVAVVGGCASGKTTVVRELRALGYDAYVVGQEHSEVATLWRRQSPDALVFLDVSLETVRHRRGSHWPAWLHALQAERLAPARDAADLIVDTGALTLEQTIQRIIDDLPHNDETTDGSST